MVHQALVCPLRKQHCTTKGVLDLNQWMHLCVMWRAVVKSSTSLDRENLDRGSESINIKS